MMLRLAVLLMTLLLLPGCSLLGHKTLDEELAAKRNNVMTASELNKLLKAHYDRGEQYYSEGKLEQAETEYSAMLELKSEEENALYRLGNIAFKKGEFEKSADFFSRTVKANPRNNKAHYNLATIRLKQAQDHFKYYTALADRKTDLRKVAKLLGDIDAFVSDETAEDNSNSLDRIAGAIKK